jgi:hypothetical protein
MNADAKAATLDLHLWSEGCGFAVERILIRKSTMSRQAGAPARRSGAGSKQLVARRLRRRAKG